MEQQQRQQRLRVVRSLIRGCRHLPLSVLRVLGGVIGTLLWVLPTRARRTTVTNLTHCLPELSPAERRRLARHSLQHTAITALEMSACWCWPVSRVQALLKDVDGRGRLEAALADEKGLIVLAPHLGNWEALGHFLARYPKPLTNLYQPPKDPAFHDWVVASRTRNGTRLAPTSRRGVLTLLKALKNGEMVGILPDQEPEPGSGVFAPFLGHPALTMTLVGHLARRTKANVLCLFAERVRGGFVLRVREADPRIWADDPETAATGLNATVAEAVRGCPAQYQWEYKRFKKRPDQAPRWY